MFAIISKYPVGCALFVALTVAIWFLAYQGIGLAFDLAWSLVTHLCSAKP